MLSRILPEVTEDLRFYYSRHLEPIDAFEETGDAEATVRLFSRAFSLNDIEELFGAEIQVPEGLFKKTLLLFREFVL